MTSLRVGHQFDDAAQQRHAATLGMWLFLATEALLFSVLFTAYAACRAAHPAAFAEGGHHLYKWIAVANAAVLLLSSAAMATAVHSEGSRVRAAWLGATAFLGACFLALKGVEYALDIRESMLPGVRFDSAPFAEPAHAALFLVFYWLMTGLHALHVTVGVCVVSSLAVRSLRAAAPRRLDTAVGVAGLYWHLVDIVWLFLLPLLYLTP